MTVRFRSTSTLAVVCLIATLSGCANCGGVTISGKDGGKAGGTSGVGGGISGTGGGISGTGGGAAGGLATGGGFTTAGGDADGGADAGSTQICFLVSCQSANASCGPVGDGCGGYLNCGTCTPPQTCGGGGIPSQCGGSMGCTPKTCLSENANCGPVADGCGGILNCGTCTVAGETCGGGGMPNRCGATGVNIVDGGCQGLTACPMGLNCGPIADGCGSTISCGTCTVAGQSCGGGGMPNVCGASASCTPRSCAQAQATCGQVGDGCGALTPNCGTCNIDAGVICGGGGIPNVCGSNIPDAGSCTGLCPRQNQCDAGVNSVTGTIFAPTNAAAGYGNPDPIPGALVYVPNGTVQPVPQGASCTTCSGQASGSPLVTTTSATNGTFTLNNVPCGANVPLVIQLGKWRRQVIIPNVNCCGPTALPADLTRLPRTAAEGDIPLIAMVTGGADPMECILPKIGIASSEFTLPTGQGRVRMFQDNGAGFAGGAPNESTLFGNPAELAKYDLVIVDCVGGEVNRSAAELTNIRNYLNSGGRIYLSHYGYVFLYTNAPLSTVATWAPESAITPSTQNAFINTTFPKGLTFSQWLQLTGGSTTAGRMSVQQVRRDTDGLTAMSAAQTWVSSETPGNGGAGSIPLQFTFNTPLGVPVGQQCGRVLFSDFHVATGGSTSGTFPASCGGASAMSAQEKVLEFMIFDLTSCIQPDNGQSTCSPRTCQQQGFTCGQQGDGCGGVIPSCGMCPMGQTCGGGGQPGVCGGSMCMPRTCQQQNIECGQAGDGCGNVIPNCGTCPMGQVCGAGGPGRCGSGACVPRTCQQQSLSCGPAGDGCGNLIQCGPCTAPDTCGGGGTPGVCGRTSCQPRTCMQANAACGLIADGCGGTVSCGNCIAPLTCGGGGVANQCGGIM